MKKIVNVRTAADQHVDSEHRELPVINGFYVKPTNIRRISAGKLELRHLFVQVRSVQITWGLSHLLSGMSCDG